MAPPLQDRSRRASDRASPFAGSLWPACILGTAIFVAVISFLARSGTFNIELDFYDSQFWKTYFSADATQGPIGPEDYLSRARQVLQSTPLVDGHNDFPFLLRQQLHSKIYGHDFENERLKGHTDIKKMKEGMMG
ncbi:MAG: hypothetical protein Q9181_008276, partial [Wetmoreana brouardii]